MSVDQVATQRAPPGHPESAGDTMLYGVFFASGLAAIVYQIVWQRALFTTFGTSHESVTLVVTAFMLGLGLGSYAGGVFAAKPERPLVLAFAGAEVGVGLFGVISLPLFRLIGERTTSVSGLWIGVISLAVLLVPTLLMGCTLPLLVTHAVRRSRSVGASIGRLYAANTLGSAAGAVAAAQFLLAWLGEYGSVLTAAVLNLAVAGAVLAVWKSGRD